LASRLLRSLDVEGKVPRAIEALGPVGGREVILLGGGTTRARQLENLGARVSMVDDWTGHLERPDASADAVVSFWSGFRDASLDELHEVDRVLRSGGRLLVVHDYGRDDVSRLRGDLPEYGSWSRRDGWFFRNGFRIRVVHCFWTFDTMDAMAAFVQEAFGAAGSAIAGPLKRPRLSYNVAVYHRTKGGA
jgi:SAM-dependent methyltransferase